jgi:uncharacterized protein (DUF4415 family)
MADSVIQFNPRNPLVRTMSNAEMDAAEARQRQQTQQSVTQPELQYQGLAGYIRQQWDMMVRHRNTVNGWSDRLLAALRAYNGQYDPTKLSEIRKFGGSEVYARLIAAKCRGASSLLRDVYLGADRPWGLTPPSDPPIPMNVIQSIEQLVEGEVQSNAQGAPAVPPDPMTGAPGSPALPGQQPDPDIIRQRVFQLMEAARDAAKQHAREEVEITEDKIDQILTEGNFYTALGEFLTMLTIFPAACIKGPTVRMVMDVKWDGNVPSKIRKPRLWWEAPSLFDLWWSPGVSVIEDAQIIHRIRITRTDLNDLIGLAGYNSPNIRQVLQNYGTQGLTENWDSTDSTRAVLENRENPVYNLTNLITTLEFHGNVQGRMLLEYGFTPQQIPDELRDYAIQAWLIGQYLIKVQLSPSPRQRHPFYITSFEKVPSAVLGNGIPDVISDLGEVANAVLRSLVNNLSISSGPQVVVNDDRLAGQENGEELFPWKRWHTTNPAVAGSTEPAVSFFQPQSNAQELLTVFNAFYGLADDVSAIPRYLSGNSPGGGAGRTASGLAMLMGNASKILQTVCGNIDTELNKLLRELLDLILLTDRSGMLTGEEEVQPKGVVVAVQRETMRQRQLEFLQLTGNPIDMQIIGPSGRAKILRAVSTGIGLDGEDIVPSDEQMKSQQQGAQQQAVQQGVPGHAMAGPGQPPGHGGLPPQGAPGNKPPKSGKAMGPITNVTPARVAGGVG